MKVKKCTCYKEKTDLLAKFIAENWHCCPIDENISVKDCGCWGCDHCTKCIMENAEHLK